MERIAIVGVSLSQVELTVLERVKSHTGDLRKFARLVADELGASEAVVLSTCNRLEIVFAREEGHLPCLQDVKTIGELFGLEANAGSVLGFAAGLEAARRLFRVVCSLDSLVLGEDQILAQTREAFARAEHDGLCGPLLTPLFQRAFQIGKEARTRTDLSRHTISVASIGIEQLARAVASAGAPDTANGPRELAILGAGEMATLAAKYAAGAGFKLRCVASRSLQSAERLARAVGAEAWLIGDFLRSGPPVHALVSATSAPGVVVDAAALVALAERLPAGVRLCALDLALPRDLAPCDDPRITVSDLEQLRALAAKHREERLAAAKQVEALIEHKLESFGRGLLERRAATTLAEVHGESCEIAARELSSLSEPRFATLSQAQRREVEEWARQAFGRLEHAPLRAIKRWIEHHGEQEEQR